LPEVLPDLGGSAFFIAWRHVKEQTMTKLEFTFPLEIMKQTEESGEFHIVGYAATTDFDLQGDVITEEALKNSSPDLLKNSTVLLNHDIEKSIGKVTKAEFDKNGLLIDVLISQTEPDIIQKIKEGILNKFSIRGQVLEREKKYMAEFDRVVNVIKKMVLVEVSLVSVPANPEARAIGWYVKKALDEIDSLKKGGDPMSKEETVIEELKPDDPKPGDTPAPADPKPEDPKPEPEKNPIPSDQPPEKVAGKETKKKDKETMKGNEMVAKIEPVWMMLDKLIALGGEIAPAAIEIKSTLKQAVGETWTPPVVIPPAAPETVSKEEMAEMISTEVKKQIEPLLKQIPAIRKGVIQPEEENEEVKKTFEGLPPQKKLKVALALHQA
jgi:HK97 family phage prohead protease